MHSCAGSVGCHNRLISLMVLWRVVYNYQRLFVFDLQFRSQFYFVCASSEMRVTWCELTWDAIGLYYTLGLYCEHLSFRSNCIVCADQIKIAAHRVMGCVHSYKLPWLFCKGDSSFHKIQNARMKVRCQLIIFNVSHRRLFKWFLNTWPNLCMLILMLCSCHIWKKWFISVLKFKSSLQGFIIWAT